MKKKLQHFAGKILILAGLFSAISCKSMAQASINLSTSNCAVSGDEIQMDILLTNTGKADLRWNGCVIRMNIPAALIPSGNPAYTFNYLGGSDFPMSFPEPGKKSAGAFFNTRANILTWCSTPNKAYNNHSCSAPLIAPGQKKLIGRFSFKLKNAVFPKAVVAGFTWNVTGSCILYENCNIKVSAFNTEANRIFTDPCILKVPE